MTTPNKPDAHATSSFIEEVVGDAALRIDTDFGHGFVRLKTSEAEKRQAAQDIRASEDVVIELLRNARDAHARNIFLATQREGDRRIIAVIDDGDGIPEDMRELVFEPRVTSKLDTASLDRWGLHGRGMALYSIQVNADEARVASTAPGLGTAIRVALDMGRITEKTDQSTFPRFEMAEGKMCMRGPKNILRTASEFALEHKDAVNVHCGSFTEIASALCEYGMATCSPALRAFPPNREESRLIQRLAFAADPLGFSEIAASLGLEISPRSCRRIMDGEIAPAPALLERIKGESLGSIASPKTRHRKPKAPSRAKVRIARDDLDAFAQSVAVSFSDLAAAYFLDAGIEPDVRVADGLLRVEIPLKNAD